MAKNKDGFEASALLSFDEVRKLSKPKPAAKEPAKPKPAAKKAD